MQPSIDGSSQTLGYYLEPYLVKLFSTMFKYINVQIFQLILTLKYIVQVLNFNFNKFVGIGS